MAMTDEVPTPTPTLGDPAPDPPKLRAVAFAPSSQIASVTYDSENMALIVSFQRGGIYRYAQVPENVAQGFESAPSAGKYLNEFVKGIYDFERIS